MNEEWISGWTEAFGWSLVHFVWQGAAITLGLWVLLTLLQKASPQWRYAISGIAMASLLVCFVTTLMGQVKNLPQPVSHEAFPNSSTSAMLSDQPESNTEVVPIPPHLESAELLAPSIRKFV